MAKKSSATDHFKNLTWNDLEDWAGTSIVSRGRSYQRSGRVQGLARTPSGGLVAWVQGTEKYATQVEVEDDELLAACTCPYGGTCKHAVAVVLEYLENLKKKSEVPTATQRDRRLALLQEIDEEASIEEDEFDAEEEYEDADDAPPRRSREAADALRSYLEGQTKAQLIDLLEELAESHPLIHQALRDRRDVAVGSATQLMKAVREEIRELSAQPGWRNEWDGEGYTPDYTGVRDRLQVLLDKGYADEVVALGKELLAAGIQQVEMSHDEGETAGEISSCLDVVFRALPQSSLAPADQILWVVEAELNDDYDLCQGAEAFWKQEHSAADWNIVADKLARRLKQLKSTSGEDDFSRNYRRDRLSNWLIHALSKAGREAEIIPLCEREAEETGSYVRLVNYLKEAGRWEEAEQWIYKGVEATQKPWPGIAGQLRDMLRQIREREKDWLRVAAFHAEDFFRNSTLNTFQELRKAAERAEVWPAVRAAAMHYLETGELPQSHARSAKRPSTPAWPLPETGLADESPRWQPQFPVIETLIDIAIAEKRTDDVIRWYDQLSSQPMGWGWSGSVDDKVAKAVADTHPERALVIWKEIAEDYIAQTNTSAYQAAVGFLRKVYRLLSRAGREKEWQTYLAQLRQANARKRRLLEMLDNLSGKRIIEGS